MSDHSHRSEEDHRWTDLEVSGVKELKYAVQLWREFSSERDLQQSRIVIQDLEKEAVDCCSKAISELKRLAPSYTVRNYRAMAYYQRGLLLEKQGREKQALRDFMQVVEVIDRAQGDLQAMTMAAAFLRIGVLQRRKDFVVVAHGLVVELSGEDVLAARISLKACREFCSYLCQELEAGDLEVDEWIVGATKAQLEGALILERNWYENGEGSLRPTAMALFDLGLKINRLCQPHLLARFIKSCRSLNTEEAYEISAKAALELAFDESLTRSRNGSSQERVRELMVRKYLE